MTLPFIDILYVTTKLCILESFTFAIAVGPIDLSLT